MKENADYLPDTNAVLRYLLQDDADQFPLAEIFFKKVMEGRTRVIFLEGVLVECLYVLTKYYKVTSVAALPSMQVPRSTPAAENGLQESSSEAA